MRNNALWATISDNELKTLKVLILTSSIKLDDFCNKAGFTKATYFNKLSKRTKFKPHEINSLLSTLGITRNELKDLANNSKILNYIEV